MDYTQSLRWLLALPDFERTGHFAERPDLVPMRALLRALGDPHLGRATVHIAGSKGKGSTAVMVESILKSAGQRTGCYISPHLHRYNERIRIAGAPSSREAFASALTATREATERVTPQFAGREFVAFDALTAAAFVAFREAGCDAQVVEVGLGGALDSTNVFHADDDAAPGTADVVVLTPISLEHTAVLGNTIAEIAAQKAGIITRGSIVVVAPQRESARDVFGKAATGSGAKIVEVAAVCQVQRTSASQDGQEFRLKTTHEYYRAKLPLAGRHQLDNAATAIVACEELAARRGFALTPEHVIAGLASFSWPARVEVIRRRPLVIIDGAHNGDSAKRLVEALREHFGLSHVTLLFGTLAGKDVDAMAAALVQVSDAVFATGWASARAAAATDVAAACRPYDAAVTAFASLEDAYEAASGHAGERGAIVACGALAFVAQLREYLLGIESDRLMLASSQDIPLTEPASGGPPPPAP